MWIKILESLLPPKIKSHASRIKKIISMAGLGLIILLVGGVFLMAQPFVRVADDFFGAAADGNIAEAYTQYVATETKQNTSLEAYKMRIGERGLEQVVKTSFPNSSKSKTKGSLSGTITRKDGSTAPITISFVKEEGEWKILSFVVGGALK